MFPILKKKGFVNSGSLNWDIFRFRNMVPEIKIKVSESGTITEAGNIAFQFRDNEYLFIYLFIYFVSFGFLLLLLLFLNVSFSKHCSAEGVKK